MAEARLARCATTPAAPARRPTAAEVSRAVSRDDATRVTNDGGLSPIALCQAFHRIKLQWTGHTEHAGRRNLEPTELPMTS